ncbi:MAG: NAD(P)/FAD-dependent oxidoreductase ['Candidatus Kapabacteria' thiocyanatum]|uniref:Aminoacetone oxidase family FAD-binding enzyme n=1 Tax=Candidatus Kapaibacterium thiocyanatum TaxID=1895771 RepID=A0A1M3L1M2_9BACT|nr:NAD(P)/FAD-dependent oxidoreductase ['Candidatus Kapabacteria' thiocyanatum]OJX58832.1 MAG: hypothetical protein BGO89_03470 ['Candidatus Kapabacteria' thiocyanatum]
MMDVVVLGAGAAGLFCAAVAASRGKRVLVLEHNDRPGKKIRISGGGRCNFTNVGTTHRNFISDNPDFARSALTRYTPQDFLDLVERHGIAWHEKKLGQLFCDESSQRIIDMLVDECRRSDVELRMRVRVKGVRRADDFIIETDGGDIHASHVVVATGGLSIPSLGASDLGYRIARHFGIALVTPGPALVPLTFDDAYAARFGSLSGISIDAVANAGNVPFRENILFTHRGLSGPAILQASSYWKPGEGLSIDLLPDHGWNDLIPDQLRELRTLGTVLSTVLPRRFVQQWNDERYGMHVNRTQRRVLEAAVQDLKTWSVIPNGTEGYAKAEVTRGGIDTRALSSKTMEVRSVQGLYMIGEVVDVTGWLGGYNFQWAWASASAAGSAIAEA